MAKRVELLFDIVSPNAYLMWWPLRDLARRHDSAFDVVPVFLAGMHRLTGNAPPMIRDAEVKGKNAYAQVEMDRFIADHRLSKFVMHPQFPFNSILFQRLLFAADEVGRGVDFAEFLLRAVWEERIDVSDPQSVAGAVGKAGFDASDLMARAQTDAVKTGLADNTDRAVARGAFGLPTVFVSRNGGASGDEMFFGKERLGQIDRALRDG